MNRSEPVRRVAGEAGPGGTQADAAVKAAPAGPGPGAGDRPEGPAAAADGSADPDMEEARRIAIEMGEARFAAIRRGYARRSGRPAPPEADAAAAKDAADGAPAPERPLFRRLRRDP